MSDVADREQLADADRLRGSNHRAKRLGGVPVPPCVRGEHVPGFSVAGVMNLQPGTAEQRGTRARSDKARNRSASIPDR